MSWFPGRHKQVIPHGASDPGNPAVNLLVEWFGGSLTSMAAALAAVGVELPAQWLIEARFGSCGVRSASCGVSSSQ